MDDVKIAEECAVWALDELPKTKAVRIKIAEKKTEATETILRMVQGDITKISDVDEIVNAKMDKNEAKYPVEKARGSAAKYDQL